MKKSSKKDSYCENCGKELKRKQKVYCSVKCNGENNLKCYKGTISVLGNSDRVLFSKEFDNRLQIKPLMEEMKEGGAKILSLKFR